MTNELGESTPLLLDHNSVRSVTSDTEGGITPIHEGSEELRNRARLQRWTKRQWAVLIICCAVPFANYYCYDIPGALNVPLQRHLGIPYDRYQTVLNTMYSLYALPNVLLPLIGGVMTDIYPPGMVLLFFSTFILLGQSLFSVGVDMKSVEMMYIGRVVMGSGGESLDVGVSRVMVEAFGDGLGFAMSLGVGLCRVAGAMGDVISPLVGVMVAGWVGVAVAVASVLAAAGVAGMLARKQRLEEVHQQRRRCSVPNTPREETESLLGDGYCKEDEEEDRYSYDSAGDEHVQLPSVVETPPDVSESGNETDASESPSKPMKPSFTMRVATTLRQIPFGFWILCACTLGLYGASVPFFHVCTDFFQQTYGVSPARAGVLMSIPDVISAPGTPITGFLLDYLSHRQTVPLPYIRFRILSPRVLTLPISGLLMALTHVMFLFRVQPEAGMAVMGVGYTLFAGGVWSCVPEVCRHVSSKSAGSMGDNRSETTKNIGLSYGILTVTMNIGLTVLPQVVAYLRAKAHRSNDQGNGSTPDASEWTGVLLFLMVLSLISAAGGGWMWWRKSRRVV
ncbi:major facilitator superfamily domain-containing protein [Gaertneriomyces semiglobifer]|nr:major facilitator superfamily domain-containing protein [Gaertneriomyces semiglobifer]